MEVSTDAAPRSGGRGRSEARERLLATATALFYGEGIRAVGVDRILAETPTTRATFYRHFPSKEDLVVAYLRGVDALTREAVRAAEESGPSAAEALRTIGATIAGDLTRPGFRGCAFLQAATEFPDPDDPVHRVVVDHRAWYLATITDLFARAYGDAEGRPDPERAARHFVMLRDGAMSGAHLDGTAEAADTVRRGVDGLLAVVHRGPDALYDLD
jgi:AcrR family transcriptional regulator